MTGEVEWQGMSSDRGSRRISYNQDVSPRRRAVTGEVWKYRQMRKSILIYDSLSLIAYYLEGSMDKQLAGTAQDFIKEHGAEALQAIVTAIRPFIPMLVTNQELIPIAIALASSLIPITITSTYVAVRTITNISLFSLQWGLNMATTTAKVSYSVAKGTVSLASDVLITKPIYLLSYPFRRHSSELKVMEMLETCRLQQHQLQTYKAAYCSAVQQPGTVFVIIKGKDDMKVMMGSLDSKDRVERLLPLITGHNRGQQKDSLHLICNKTILRLDTPLSTLPRNQFGAIEIYYFMMEPFG